MRAAIQMDSSGDHLGRTEGLQLFDMPKLLPFLLFFFFFFLKSLLLKRQFLSQACALRERNKESKNRIRWEEKKHLALGLTETQGTNIFFAFLIFFIQQSGCPFFQPFFSICHVKREWEGKMCPDNKFLFQSAPNCLNKWAYLRALCLLPESLYESHGGLK